MEEFLKLITLNNEQNDDCNLVDESPRQLSQRSYPFRICDLPLPQCNAGFAYMLTLIKRQTY